MSSSRKDDNWCNVDFLALQGSDEEKEKQDDGREDHDDDIQDFDVKKKYSLENSYDYQEGQQDLDESTEHLPPWMEYPVSQSTNPLVRLHNEIVDFCHMMEPTSEELVERNMWISKFRVIALDCFHNKCEIEVFGSQYTGLLLPTSDIDIVIMLQEDDKKKNVQESMNKSTDEKASKDLDAAVKDSTEWSFSESQTSPLHRLASAIRDAWLEDLDYLDIIENTPVPLVKLTTTTGLSIDICFNQENGPQAARLMSTYLKAMPPLRPLTFVLKYFLASRGLNEPYSGGIGSYLLQLMIVSFLQHRERESYNFGYPSVYNLGGLLMEFLQLYGVQLNYFTTGISVRHDGAYFPKGSREKVQFFYDAARPFSLAVENPLDPTMNVGKSSFRIEVIQRSMEIAYLLLLSFVAEPIQPTPSILGTILPSSPEMELRARKSKGQSRASRSETFSRHNKDYRAVSPTHKRQRRH
jgi:non-canonical poly(A) RNA polymerase PAPD5/7